MRMQVCFKLLALLDLWQLSFQTVYQHTSHKPSRSIHLNAYMWKRFIFWQEVAYPAQIILCKTKTNKQSCEPARRGIMKGAGS